MFDQKVEAFLERLQRQPDSKVVTNPYRNPHCVENLRHYLQQMLALQPKVLLVGEAPGYKGCGITGIPFSSGKIFEQIDHPLLQQLRDRLVLPKIDSENTASMVWRYLAERAVTPLFWNAYPYHPHPASNRQKNRAPSSQEIAAGVEYLQAIVALFQPVVVAGIGHAGTRCARQGLPEYKVDYVRHPSYGGKRDFITGMEQIFQKP